jgi:hypothetical protein
MRKCFALLGVALLVTTAATAFGKVSPQDRPLPFERITMPGETDLPAKAPDGFARSDTFNFGYYTVVGGAYYAVQGEMWTWDHGAPNALEGWYAVDLSANTGAFFQRITAASWAGHGNEVAAPLVSGSASAWVGVFEDAADALCWDAGLGYGNNWCQRWTSSELTYDGTGAVSLAFKYFNDTETNFDYSKVILRLFNGTETSLNGVGFHNKIGDPSISSYPTFNKSISEGDFEGQTKFRILFEMTADGGYSDEDGSWATNYGPFRSTTSR